MKLVKNYTFLVLPICTCMHHPVSNQNYIQHGMLNIPDLATRFSAYCLWIYSPSSIYHSVFSRLRGWLHHLSKTSLFLASHSSALLSYYIITPGSSDTGGVGASWRWCRSFLEAVSELPGVNYITAGLNVLFRIVWPIIEAHFVLWLLL